MNLLTPKILLIKEEGADQIKTLRFSSSVIPKISGRKKGLVIFGLTLTGVFVLPALVYTAQNALPETGNENADSVSIPINTTQTVSIIPGQPGVVPVILPSLSGANMAVTQTAPARLIVNKINVNMHIVQGATERSLLRGAWQYPQSGDPETGGNTVLFGHRYLHLPPSHETFFSLDKLVQGDNMQIQKNGKTFNYIVTETKTVKPNEVSVLDQTQKPTVTLITCTPLFTSKNRLVVKAELASIN